jgi:hypothetical protein
MEFAVVRFAKKKMQTANQIRSLHLGPKMVESVFVYSDATLAERFMIVTFSLDGEDKGTSM